MTSRKLILQELQAIADPKRAKASLWYFKTGPGQYGEGDVFIGITVPQMRRIATRYRTASRSDVAALLKSRVHEHRFVALEILTMQYERGNAAERKSIVSFYTHHRDRINNWDLVDTSAPYILGDYLLTTSTTILDRYARSRNLWDRRIAIVSTFPFIRTRRFAEPKRIAEKLLHDKEDLIHKAVGWMLREMGKQSKQELIAFLNEHYQTMPRTMLRYAIERLPESERRRYLAKR